jgi:hypothetical protein
MSEAHLLLQVLTQKVWRPWKGFAIIILIEEEEEEATDDGA